MKAYDQEFSFLAVNDVLDDDVVDGSVIEYKIEIGIEDVKITKKIGRDDLYEERVYTLMLSTASAKKLADVLKAMLEQ